MAQQIINIGENPNDGDGDPIRTAFVKCNANFTELYDRVTSVPITGVGVSTDRAGMLAFDSDYLYYCWANFDGVTQIWRRVAGSSLP